MKVGFRRVAMVSYRLGGLDGVSVEADKWRWALEQLGLEVTTVAGAGTADVLVSNLGAWDGGFPDTEALEAALAGADLVVAENICSLPLNPAASEAVAAAMQDRPGLIHHHDLAWQRPGLGDRVANDRRWVHVTVNDLSRRQLESRGIGAVTVRNRFEPDPTPGDGAATRVALGLEERTRLVLQPTRAIARKNVAAGLAVADALGATFWLTGPAEEDYRPELDRLLSTAPVPVIHRPAPLDMSGAYAAADAVVLPSWWEGFGNPAVEASIHRRPVLVGPYPVADELIALGFRWFRRATQLAAFLDRPDTGRLEHNRAVAAGQLSLDGLPAILQTLLDELEGRSAD
ncbi:MAG TPA: glycosyltransferase [Acidimicrobiales bacterium]|nr:glycosyltransferase [Acidimicrobiales bacterium]